MKSKQEIIFKDLFEIPIKNGLFKPTKVRGSGTKMINMGEIFAIDRMFDIPMELVPLTDIEEKHAIIKKNDLIFARSSLADGAGKCSIFLGNEKTTFESHIIRVRINQKIANPKFYYYYFNSISGKNSVYSITEKTAASGIRSSDLANLHVPFPTKDIQDSVIKQLEILDIKIENLQNQNKILEQTMLAIFKSWFVDFDGVTKWDISEKGKIPKGWEISTIGKKLEVILGGTPSRNNESYWENGIIPWINSGKVNEFRIIYPSELITEEGLKKSSTRLIPKRTTVLAITGATLGQVSLLEIDSCTNQSVIAIKGNDEIPSEYIYYYIKSVIENIISSQTGGAQQHINRQNVCDANLLVPKKEVMKKYFQTSKPYLDLISDNCFQIQLLTQTRDVLLPKLMSGEIKV